MIEARLFVDDAVGETRRVLVDKSDRPFRIDVERWTERDRRARADEIWAARLLEAGPDGGCFVDLGVAGQGLLRSRKAATLAQGARLAVRVRSESRDQKGVVVDLADIDLTKVEATGRISEAETEAFLVGVSVIERLEGGDARPVVDAAIEEATSERVDIASGGCLWMEVTRAVSAIDVDRGASIQKLRELNIAAAIESGRQVSLRALAGLVVVDHVASPRGPEAAKLSNQFVATVQRLSGCQVDSVGLSRFGLLQAAIARRRRPLSDALLCAPEAREALDALRDLETKGWDARASRFEIAMSKRADRWLRTNMPDWEGVLGDRIGRRWRQIVADQQVGAAQIRVME